MSANKYILIPFFSFFLSSAYAQQAKESKKIQQDVNTEVISPDNKQASAYHYPNPEHTYTLVLEGFEGDIRIEGTEAGNEVLLQAFKTVGSQNIKQEAQARAGFYNNALFEAEMEGNTLVVKSLAVNDHVDFVIKVPEKTNLKLKINKSGNVNVSDLREMVEIDNNEGTVTMNNLSGWAVVNTVQGDIIADFESVFQGKTMSFITLNGNVYLTLPEDLNANLKVRNNSQNILNAFEEKEITKQNSVGEVIRDTIAVQNTGIAFQDDREDEKNSQDNKEQERKGKSDFSKTTTNTKGAEISTILADKNKDINSNLYINNLNSNSAMSNVGRAEQVQTNKAAQMVGKDFETKLNFGGSLIYISTRNGIVEIKKKEK